MTFSCNNVPLSTLQLPGCEEAVTVIAVRITMASESLGRSLKSSFSSFQRVKRKLQDQQAHSSGTLSSGNSPGG